MNIYISSSWKNREAVRAIAVRLREAGHEVYDFTDPTCRTTPEIPPERYPDLFDPERDVYREYITAVPEWRTAVEENRKALDRCDVVVLLLPCGNDAHADWAYAVGAGKRSIVYGTPRERSTTHLWADAIVDDLVDDIDTLVVELGRMAARRTPDSLRGEFSQTDAVTGRRVVIPWRVSFPEKTVEFKPRFEETEESRALAEKHLAPHRAQGENEILLRALFRAANALDQVTETVSEIAGDASLSDEVRSEMLDDASTETMREGAAAHAVLEALVGEDPFEEVKKLLERSTRFQFGGFVACFEPSAYVGEAGVWRVQDGDGRNVAPGQGFTQAQAITVARAYEAAAASAREKGSPAP